MSPSCLLDRRTLLKGSATIGAGAFFGASITSCSRAPVSAISSPPRVLLAYFSRAGENYHFGGRIDLEVGNTQVVSDMISSATDVDVYRIDAADPYPRSYDETVERNTREQDTDARPAIANSVPSLTNYDAVLLGSPIWNVQPPMIMRTFVESANLRGKTIHPFVTYAVSGLGNTEDIYTELCPDSTIGQALAIRGEEVREAGPDVATWLSQIGLST